MMQKLITTYERSPITENIGSDRSKISFLQEYPRIANFKKGKTIFNVSGIFQLNDGPPLLILPWFLNDPNIKERDSVSGSLANTFFSLNKNIKTYLQATIDLENDPQTGAFDIIFFSYVTKVKSEIEYLITHNFHSEATEKLTTIKGRWLTNVDLNYSKRPVSFTCQFGSLTKDIPVLSAMKAILNQVRQLLRTKRNLSVVEESLKLLKEIEQVPFSQKIINEAKGWASRNKGFEPWVEILSYAESIFFEQDVYSKDSGISFHFKMDDFFEELLLKICKGVRQASVRSQKREEILGGSLWVSDNLMETSGDVRKSSYSSRPDLILETDGHYHVIECKYKPFKIPYINESSKAPDLIRFGRDDRNQILSFILSLRPSFSIRNKSVTFTIAFPTRDVETIATTDLVFSAAKLHLESRVKNLVQSSRSVQPQNTLRIRFLAINIKWALEKLSKKTPEVSEVLEKALDRGLAAQTDKPESQFQRALKRRVALSSIIVNKNKSDPYLGRTKLAKLIYLADAKLNLGLMGQYSREAAGPLDPRMIYNPKVGLEAICEKQSIFRAHYVRNGNNKVRYIPLSNLKTFVSNAEQIFFEKINEIHRILDITSTLNTERSEIIATLFACWNDMIINGTSNPSTDQIILDFRNNWHESKKRFEDDRLKRALKWMKSNDLTPEGFGPITAHSIDKNASSF